MVSVAASLSPKERLAVLFDEVAELTGQRNAIDARVVEIVSEIEHRNLAGMTGCRSIPALVAWKTGTSPRNAETIATIAHRLEQFPRLAAGMREGRLSLDQVGVIAENAADGSDEHYAELAAVATVSQLRTAVKLEPRPDPEKRPEPPRSITKTDGPGGEYTTWKIRLPRLEAAKFEAAHRSHQDALIADWKRDHDTSHPDGADGGHDGDGGDDHPGSDPDHGANHENGGQPSEGVPPFPTGVDGFMSLIEAGWDTEVAARPHGQHTTVIAHLDVDKKIAALHLGPLLTDEERRYLLCDATCEVWFERHGRPIGAGRATRTVSRRLRRALEHRDHCCVIPGCGATRGLHAHHLIHWEDGGSTELSNLVLLCPFHHRLHHRGGITITGPADRLVVTDADGTPLNPGSLARPPTRPPPTVAPCSGPLGERADWWWYTPYEPPPPTTN